MRSWNMKQIGSKNTKPEVKLRKYLHARGFRYTIHKKTLPGKPDIYLKKYQTVILVNGCFWHGHQGCTRANLPKSNTDYWLPKIEGNILRDKKNIQKLKKIGLSVIIVWECQLKKSNFEKTINRVIKGIKKNV